MVEMPGELLYLSFADVTEVALPIAEVIEAVESAFREKGEGRTEMPPKPGIHPVQDAFIHAMPAYVSALGAAGMKWVSGYPGNRERGLPYISGLIILNDIDSGLPMCVMDAAWVTAKRTAAATAIAAKFLASAESKVFGILGCGVQGRANLEAVNEVISGLEEVRAYDVDAEAASSYADDMERTYGLEVQVASEPRGAVEGSDIVVTAGPILKDPQPAIDAGWLKEGGFACPIDFDSYWMPGAMHAIDKFCTDDIDQLKYYQTVGYFSGIPAVYADLSEIIIGRKPGRESAEERTMSMNLGIAIEDMVTAVRIFERAKAKNIGTWLSL
ncbi:MAG: ornithine cyclodeaminase family protein [Methanobacteriota archaeon]|nr:MAG: ornithine cyclodeaminase family protein [Euryarchaeota archaeon]